MANFATKVAWMSSKWAILVKFQQELKYLSGILTDLDLQNRPHFSEPVKMSPRSAILQSKVMKYPNISAEFQQFQQKLEYLSGILTDLHQTFRTGLVFPRQSKWVQGVLCYDQNWWKLKYLSRISIDMHWQFFFEFFNFFKAHFTLNQSKVTHNGKCYTTKSGLDWLKTANFGHFAGFSIFSPKMRLRLTWNGQFHPIHNFSHLLPPKHLIFLRNLKSNCSFLGKGYISKCFEFLNFFKLFHTKVAQNDPQWQILPKKWLRLAQNSQFWSFCRFFHLFPQNQAQIDSWNGQFHPIHNFSHLLPPKFLIFGEISKIFIPWRRDTSANFLSFFNFSNHFTPKQLKMTHWHIICHQIELNNFGWIISATAESWLIFRSRAHFLSQSKWPKWLWSKLINTLISAESCDLQKSGFDWLKMANLGI